jgi:catechol 2,3-dioxygenase-like lactoylglutathione lyase family enzyme
LFGKDNSIPHSRSALALVARDYNEVIVFFTEALRFTLLEDTPLGDGKRWVRVAPSGSGGTGYCSPRSRRGAGAAHRPQTGGRVFLFLETQDFWDDYHHMQAHGVRFTEEPRHEPYAWWSSSSIFTATSGTLSITVRLKQWCRTNHHKKRVSPI